MDFQARAFNGRSMASDGYSSISGVPVFGSPKIKSTIGRIGIPTACASAAWSKRAKTFIPFEPSNPSNRSIVSWTEYRLSKLSKPGVAIAGVKFCGLLRRCKMIVDPILDSRQGERETREISHGGHEGHGGFEATEECV